MSVVAAAHHPGAVALTGSGSRRRMRPLNGRLLVTLLIMLAVLGSAPSAAFDDLLSAGAAAPPATGQQLPGIGATSGRMAPAESASEHPGGDPAATPGAAGHSGGARARMQQRRQLAQCLHRARRTATDPASCLVG